VRTRLEYIIRSCDVKPASLARAARLSREHVRRIRDGQPASTKAEEAIIEGLREIVGRPFARADIFQPSTPARGKRRQIARSLAAADRDAEFALAVDNVIRAPATQQTVLTLLDVGKSLVDGAPTRSLAVFEATIALVDRLTDTPEPLRLALGAHAQKGRGTALWMRGEYRAALAAYMEAEQRFRAARYCRRELGYARYGVATVLFKMERWADAERVARSARPLLAQTHERAGVIKCDVLLGCIFLESGDVLRAREVFVTQKGVVEARGDAEMVARLTLNVAVCDLRLHETRSAAIGLDEARGRFKALGARAELARIRWCGATLLVLQKRRASAMREFRGAAHDFRRLGMNMDAGFVELEIAGELIAARKWDAAERVSRSVAALFLKAGTHASAAHALEYLREAVANRTASGEIVAAVLRHIRRTQVFPGEAFRPPGPEPGGSSARSGTN
jgi:tetratricopeptide (TPR) repeat protein